MVTVCFAGAVHAQTTKYADWHVGVTDDKEGYYAATSNDSGGVFGQYCYPKEGQCYWLLVTDVGCRVDGVYPVLVNADSGASHHELYCFEAAAKKGRYAFRDFDDISTVIAQPRGQIGVAFPLQSGRFQVSRFSLDGAEQSVKTMRNIAEAAQRQPSRSTRDTRL